MWLRGCTASTVHQEHEHMVLHRDIKASNIMLDSTMYD
jgi:serine/threonine protein kinase